MKLQEINEKVIQLKTFILDIAQLVVEPAAWKEFTDSEERQGGNFSILENDLPVFRDLKAFLNILSAIARITEKMTEHNALIGVSFGRKLELTQDFIDFRRNYKIYMSTSNIVTRYLAYAKDAFITVVLPQLKVKLIELSKLCTEENLEKIADFFIEQVISLEQYQDNYKTYLQNKSLPTPPEVVDPDKKENQDDFISVVIKKNKALLKTIYKDKFDDIFFNKPTVDAKVNNKAENKAENKADNKAGNKAGNKAPETKSDEVLDYYPENAKDTDIVKNIKLFMNGVIGVKKVMNDHTAYGQASAWYKLSWGASLIKNLTITYSSFNKFDYQAIIAEKSGPLTDELKNQIKFLNDYLEILACIADQFEVELRLKEGALLKPVDYMVDRYDEITSELRIHVDYVRQKNIYHQARQQSRKNYLRDIDFQVNEIKRFLAYKDYPLNDIPYYIKNEMKAYINKYHDDICMNKSHLATYEEYLTVLNNENNGWKAYFYNQMEYVGNRFGATIHSEYMQMLNKRVLSLQKQKVYAIQRFEKNTKYYKDNPYCFLNVSEMSELGYKKAILNALNKHTDFLALEKDKVLNLTNDLKDIPSDKPKLVEEKPKLPELTAKPAEEKSKTEDKPKPADVNSKTTESKPTDEKAKSTDATIKSAVTLVQAKAGDDKAKVTNDQIKPEEKTKAVEEKGKTVEEKARQTNAKLEKPKQRLVNQIKLKTKEYNLFSMAAKKYADENNYQPLLDMVKNEEGLTAKTTILIDEVAEAIRAQEQKTIRLD